MEVFRLCRAKNADQLSGYGAAIKGARWNLRGVEMTYTAENRSLAIAEVLVHLSLAMLPKDFMMLTIFIPDEIEIFNLDCSLLTQGWNDFPHKRVTQELGDQFIYENKYAVMRVPSVVTQGDFNLLINSGHPLFKEISIVRKASFPFDQRVFK